MSFPQRQHLKLLNYDQILIPPSFKVNNAAIATYTPTLQTPPEDILKVFGVVVVGPVLLLQAAYPHIPHGGRVINIGTVSSKMGFYQLPIYAAAKAAMDQLTFTLSREVSLRSNDSTPKDIKEPSIGTGK